MKYPKYQHQTAFKVINRHHNSFAPKKAFYWQRKAAEETAKQVQGDLLQLDGYWRPAGVDPNIVYMLCSPSGVLGIYTDKARLMTAYESFAESEAPSYEVLLSGKLNYYVEEVTLNDMG